MIKIRASMPLQGHISFIQTPNYTVSRDPKQQIFPPLTSPLSPSPCPAPMYALRLRLRCV